jgi:simple sugar transport system ATP-binding protein
MLTPLGVAELQKVLVRLKGHGLAIVFISHKLHEAFAIGDRISILKQGRLIATLDEEILRSRTPEELQRLVVETMFGEEARTVAQVAELQSDVEGARQNREVSKEVQLELDDVSAEGAGFAGGIHDLSLTVHAGEILGVAGVDGNGQSELAEMIAGQRSITNGELRLDGRPINNLSISARQRLGLRYVTDDRLGEGIVGPLSVALNLALKRIGQEPFWRRGIIQQGELHETARDLVSSFEVRTPNVETRASTLSGGNIQKVILARELSFEPRITVYNKPTQGLDVKTTRAVRQRIREQATRGVTAIVISTDLDEVLELSDRIAVLYRGRLAGIVENGPDASERIGELMIGGSAA